MNTPDLPALACQVIDKAGGTAALAKRLGYVRQRVHYWRQRGIPAEQVPLVHQVTGIPRHELRPDLWPAQSEGEAA